VSDDTIRALERELARAGVSAEDWARRILGIDKDRFWFWVAWGSQGVDEKKVEGFERVTLMRVAWAGQGPGFSTANRTVYEREKIMRKKVATLEELWDLTCRFAEPPGSYDLMCGWWDRESGMIHNLTTGLGLSGSFTWREAWLTAGELAELDESRRPGLPEPERFEVIPRRARVILPPGTNDFGPNRLRPNDDA